MPLSTTCYKLTKRIDDEGTREREREREKKEEEEVITIIQG
jgi:hypothetical protein